jgi:hypothetical protein
MIAGEKYLQDDALLQKKNSPMKGSEILFTVRVLSSKELAMGVM